MPSAIEITSDDTEKVISLSDTFFTSKVISSSLLDRADFSGLSKRSKGFIRSGVVAAAYTSTLPAP